MKKITALLLLLTISLSLFGCKVEKYRSSWDGFCYAFNGKPVAGNKRLESGGPSYILDILNSGAWEVGTFDCDYDFYFSTMMEQIYYHSLCGTFYDVTNGIILKVTEEQRLTINSFLKDELSEKFIWEGFFYTPQEFFMELEPKGTEYILNLIDNGDWENGHPNCNCISEYWFTRPRQRIYYHSECGMFYDVENGKFFKVTEEQRTNVNLHLEHAESTRYASEGYYYLSSGVPKRLDLNEIDYILDLLNDNVWEHEPFDCDYDYYLLQPNQKIYYHSECGTFTDTERGRSFKVTEEQRLEINRLLSVGVPIK